MATHNRLLGLGDLYLEVIAPDPATPPPARPRWFDLDRFTGPPRLAAWICRTDDLAAALAQAPKGSGVPVPMQRGDYRWQVAVPDDGILPYDNAYPALIAWQGDKHPAKALTDQGIRLTALDICHPRATALAQALASQFDDPRVRLFTAPHVGLRAVFDTPNGTRVLT